MEPRPEHQFVLAIAAGVVLALPYVLYALRGRESKRVFAVGLVLAAGVYVVLAAVAGDWRRVLVELGGVLLFGAIGFLGVRSSASWLALGWAAHVGWDLLLHPFEPFSYPAVCVGFDLVVAGAILGTLQRKPTELRLAHAVRHLGDNHRRNGESAQAARCYDEALRLYRRDPDALPLDVANALRGAALLAEQTGDGDRAIALWQEARGLYEKAGVAAGVAEAEARCRRESS